MNEHPPNGSRWEGTAGAGRWLLFACLLLAGPLVGAETNRVLHLGFSSSVFATVNENDAKAAMKVWGQSIAQEYGVMFTAEPTLFNSGQEIASAVRNKSIDAVTMTAEEYSILNAALLSSNAIVGMRGGQMTEEYLLLVRRDSDIGRIEDLRGRSLIFFHNARASLAPIWFETLLLKSGLGQTSQFCGRVTQAVKLTQAVLPVFFRQADACLVTRQGFETMVELNPQIGQQLKTLEASPAMLPVVFVFRSDYSDPLKHQIESKIPSTVAGRQFLTLFQCDSMETHPVSVLDSALELLATHARLIDAANHAALAHAGIPISNGKTGGP